MTRRFAIASVIVGALAAVFGPNVLHAATCTGANPCSACRNCWSCKRCAKEGGTCGTCKKARESEAQ